MYLSESTLSIVDVLVTDEFWLVKDFVRPRCILNLEFCIVIPLHKTDLKKKRKEKNYIHIKDFNITSSTITEQLSILTYVYGINASLPRIRL